MNVEVGGFTDGLFFLAAYTAVNPIPPRRREAVPFLAAYTAVNEFSGPEYEPINFLAAYTAVNSRLAFTLQPFEFLSCLHGSELAPKTYNHLKEKEIPSFSRQKPSFFEVS